MLKGFKDFLLRGNVVDLAVGIAIGVAFTTLVGAIGDNFINPIVQAFGGGSSKGFGFFINSDNPKTLVNLGGILNAGLVFVVTMAVIYFFIVQPMKAAQAKLGIKEPDPAGPSTDELLTEIRDLLAAERRAG